MKQLIGQSPRTSRVSGGLAGRAGRRGRQIVAGAVLATMSFGGSLAFASGSTYFEGFEGFTYASGTTVAGYDNWTTSNTANGQAVVNNDLTAYQGNNYLRLVDPDTNSEGAGGDTISSPVFAGGANISFALRDDADGSGFNNDQVVIYGNSGSYIALQCGLKYNSTNGTANFTYTPYTGNTAGTTVTSNASVVAAANTWYLFNIAYTVSPTTYNGNPAYAGSATITVTNETTDTAVAISQFSGSQTVQSDFASLANANLSSIVVETSKAGVGPADIDSISISNAVPEPASIGGIGLMAGALSLRRRRRTPCSSGCPTARD